MMCRGHRVGTSGWQLVRAELRLSRDTGKFDGRQTLGMDRRACMEATAFKGAVNREGRRFDAGRPHY